MRSSSVATSFVIMLCDGLVYGTTCRFIDNTIPMRYNLIAITAWLVCGDMGSLIGGNLISYLRDMIGSVN